MKIGSVKAGGVPLVTLGVAGLAKPVLEGVIARTPLGNGTIVSGIGKLAGAGVVRYIAGNNQIVNGIQIALAMDGVEDIFYGVMGGGFFGGGSASANAW